MKHKMNLWNDSFEAIKDEWKTIEMFLIASYDKRFEKIEEKLEVVMDNFIDHDAYKHYLILNGGKNEADIACQNI